MICFHSDSNDKVREAMHAFLSLSRWYGCGTLNAGHDFEVHEEVDKELLILVEDVLFNRNEKATHELFNYAESG
ncbi:MAG: hypothetical protein IPG00_18480 [Saprospiraceae bacterium]|nr:hypothetical protein [Saprospiraceae bacterium]